MKRLFYFGLFLVLTTACAVHAQPNLTTRVVKDNLFIPWEMVYGPDDHLWFTQKNGYICRLDPGSGQTDTVYYEGQTVVNNEGGMLGLALDPDFANDPYVYVAYEYTETGNYKERVVKYTYANGTLVAPQVLLDDIKGAQIHNGCRLAIVGDKLFITTGDASNTALPQNLSAVNGKILRINLDGSIPADNPIPGSPVWSWGHRNAQGLTEHNGILYSSEHGPNNDDEVNIILKGRNYGWPAVQGFCDQPGEMQFCADSNVVEPLYAWTPTLAVSGMIYYNHPMFPAWSNSLLLTTLKDSKLYRLTLNAAGDSITAVNVIDGVNYGRLRSITSAPDGTIYIATSNSNASGNGDPVDKIIELSDSNMTSIFGLHPNSDMMMVYPNPAIDVMTLAFYDEARGQQRWHYTVTNMQGQVFQEDELEYNTLHVGSLYPGVYFLKMWNDKNEIAYKRFVKW